MSYRRGMLALPVFFLLSGKARATRVLEVDTPECHIELPASTGAPLIFLFDCPSTSPKESGEMTSVECKNDDGHVYAVFESPVQLDDPGNVCNLVDEIVSREMSGMDFDVKESESTTVFHWDLRVTRNEKSILAQKLPQWMKYRRSSSLGIPSQREELIQTPGTDNKYTRKCYYEKLGIIFAEHTFEKRFKPISEIFNRISGAPKYSCQDLAAVHSRLWDRLRRERDRLRETGSVIRVQGPGHDQQ